MGKDRPHQPTTLRSGDRRRSASRTTRRRSSGSEVCGLDRPKTFARLPAGRGWSSAVRLGVDLGQARERVRRRAHVVADQARASSAQIREMCGDEVPNVAELGCRGRGSAAGARHAEVGVDGVEEGVRRRLGEQRQHVGEGLPGAPGRVGVGVVGDGRGRHAERASLPVSAVAEPLIGGVSAEEGRRVGDALPEPRRLRPRLSDDGGHEPALQRERRARDRARRGHAAPPRGTGSGPSG